MGTEAIVDLLSTMLVQLCRHLTAFDLTLFHNYGANYPDALFLDGLLKTCLHSSKLIPDCSATIAMTTRRCFARNAHVTALCGGRLSCGSTQKGMPCRMLRRRWARTPPSCRRPSPACPQEQITETHQRRKTLYAGESLESLLGPAAELLHASIADLIADGELLELGTATFLDRPLGIVKEPGEVDRTPLVSHRASSAARLPSVGCKSCTAAGWSSAAEHAALLSSADEAQVVGVPVVSLAVAERPGVVSLADASRSPPILWSFAARAAKRLSTYEWPVEKLPWPEFSSAGEPCERTVLVHHAPPNAEPTLRLYDSRGRLRLELGFELQPGGDVRFVERAGLELPARLRALRSWEYVDTNVAPVERDLRRDNIWLRLRSASGSC